MRASGLSVSVSLCLSLCLSVSLSLCLSLTISLSTQIQVGGYYHYHKVMFQKSIRVTARSLGAGLQVVYMVVRGHEVAHTDAAAAGLQLPSGFTVPANARLQLQRIDNQTFQPLEFVPLVTLPAGYAGLLYLTTFATQTIPAGNNCEATMRLEIFWDQNCL